ncbi:hypothetical protein BaRGS_00038598 [Batillaria attramentaria]|uniref:Uncharacterized protein n=1 Tax=Batillaria attramentaria TaxID=370345 RepID=A0ABD0J611_9CAEN
MEIFPKRTPQGNAQVLFIFSSEYCIAMLICVTASAGLLTKKREEKERRFELEAYQNQIRRTFMVNCTELHNSASKLQIRSA